MQFHRKNNQRFDRSALGALGIGLLAVLMTLALAPAVDAGEQGAMSANAELDNAQRTRSTAEGALYSGLTVTGEVQKAMDDALVIKTSTGAETVQLTPQTRRSTMIEEGHWVAVDFTRTGQGVMVATEVREPAMRGEHAMQHDMKSHKMSAEHHESMQDHHESMAGESHEGHMEGQTERTRANVENPMYAGLTVTGELKSVEDNAVVINTTTGAETVQLTSDTEVQTDLTKGHWVAIDFTRSSAGVMIATEIRPVEESAS